MMNETQAQDHGDRGAESVRADRTPHVVIIGGGFCGTMVAAHLLRNKSAAGVRITLIEPRPNLGSGAAFGTQRDSDLLNVPAGKMSALPDDPKHFLTWLQKLGHSFSETSFVPRGLYGEYVRSVFLNAVSHAPLGAFVHRMRVEVTALQRSERGFLVHVDLGEPLNCDSVVLATGPGAPRRPAGLSDALVQSPRYIAQPWLPSAISDVERHEAVMLVGTGLTMLDTAISLHLQGHEGSIVAISRRGTTPTTHAIEPNATSLPDDWPKRALECAPSIRALVDAIRQTARVHEAHGGDWRSVIDALRPHIQSIWRTLPTRDRDRFMEHLLPYWESVRHRCAPEVGAAYTVLRSSGRLKVHAARLESASLQREAVLVRIRRRHHDHLETLSVDRLIACTGPQNDIRRNTQPLVQQLLRDCIATPGPLNIGFATAPNGEILADDGTHVQGFFTLGSLRKGELWESTAVPELRVQAQQVAEELVRRLAAVGSVEPSSRAEAAP